MSESVTTDLPLELFQGLWNFYRLSRDFTQALSSFVIGTDGGTEGDAVE